MPNAVTLSYPFYVFTKKSKLQKSTLFKTMYQRIKRNLRKVCLECFDLSV